jgi:hypothetical protein
MKEYVNEMLIESARKKGRLCASDMTFNATTINNYMALFELRQMRKMITKDRMQPNIC